MERGKGVVRDYHYNTITLSSSESAEASLDCLGADYIELWVRVLLLVSTLSSVYRTIIGVDYIC